MSNSMEDVQYLLDHDVPALISDVVKMLLAVKPADPLPFMRSYLMERQKCAGSTPAPAHQTAGNGVPQGLQVPTQDDRRPDEVMAEEAAAPTSPRNLGHCVRMPHTETDPAAFAVLLTPCTWNIEEYGTDLPEVDQQHQRLFKIIHHLIQVTHDFVVGAGDTEASALDRAALPIARELKEYTRYHFAEEEQHFGATAYPGKDAHVAKHRAFEQWVDKLIAQLTDKACPLTLMVSSLKFLKNWLVSHIQVVDKEYLPYVPSKMHVYDTLEGTTLSEAPKCFSPRKLVSTH